MSKRTRKLRRLNRQLDEKLTPASTAMLYQITRRIRTAPISAYQQESIRHDVIEMLQEAESRGASPEEAIGGDIAAFCDSVLAEVPPLTARERRLYAVADVPAGRLYDWPTYGSSFAPCRRLARRTGHDRHCRWHRLLSAGGLLRSSADTHADPFQLHTGLQRTPDCAPASDPVVADFCTARYVLGSAIVVYQRAAGYRSRVAGSDRFSDFICHA